MNGYYSLGLTDRDRIDASFGGGLPRGSLVLIEGGHGAGKSALTQRFCYGFCETGHSVTYVSTELEAAGFVSQMRSLSYSVVSHLLAEQMLFLHADVDTRDRMDGREAGLDGREMLTRLMHAETMWRSDVVIIDGFDSILLHDPRFEAISDENDEDDLMQNLITFFRQIVTDGTTVVFTVNPDSLSPNTLRPLRTVSDVYLDIETKSVGSEIRRNALVRKFGGMGEQVDDNIGFTVQSGRGISIVSRTVA
ncbi:ATPase domain-containing protein [Haloprofundus halobius]|uniref:ATPase domain-containing protein n=1 Tax=Haloprofundus halobius TaxID=2876194 RepID=UPI001CC92F07|nr:ATPase domain-containing protein [Haloprofundus halobius]